MARIHGISGSTKYLLKGTNAINGKKLATLEDINHFHSNYEAILAETEITVQQQHDEMIFSLGNDEVALDNQLRESIARRTVEVDGNINEINTKINTTENVFIFLGYKIQYWIAIKLRSHKIHSPYSHISRELKNVQSRKASLIANKPYIIKNECNKVVYTQKFITENISFLVGAQGEELVINALSQLSDEFHVLNDVNLHFSKAIHWREKDEYIKTCQIDHIVVGPTGIFLVETKNWKTSDIESKSDKLIWQVRRSSLALWYYLKDYYWKGEWPKIRTVIVSMHGSHSGQRLDKYIDVITPYQLCGYIAGRKSILSGDAVKKLIDIIPCRTSN
jgi:hypothetical protein